MQKKRIKLVYILLMLYICKQLIHLMMKRTAFMIAVLAACTTMAMAQNEKGRWSVIPTIGTNVLFSEPLEKLAGITAGAAVDWQVSNRIALSSGLFYSYQRYGFKKDHIPSAPSSEYTTVIGYSPSTETPPVRDGRLVVPLTVSAYIWKGLAVKAGIQANLRLHSGMADYHDVNTSSYGMKLVEDISNTGHAMHAFFFSLPVGLSYEYKRFIFDVRYIFGLQNLRYDRETTSNSMYNMTIVSHEEGYWDNQKVNQLQITLGYRIGL